MKIVNFHLRKKHNCESRWIRTANTTWCQVSYILQSLLGVPIQILTAALRLCLGSIENSLRTNESKMARKQVHEGVELRYEGGRIQLRNTSPTSIFVQSTNMNQTHQLRHQTVIKIPSGHQVC